MFSSAVSHTALVLMFRWGYHDKFGVTGLRKCTNCVSNCIGIHRIHTVNTIYSICVFSKDIDKKCQFQSVFVSRTAKIKH